MEKETQQNLEHKEDLKLSFRRATPADVDEYLQLDGTVGESKIVSVITDRNEAIKELNDCEVYLMYKNGKLAGSAEYQIKSPDHAYMSGMIIAPEFQGQGLAREAVLFRLEKLKGIKRVDVVTHPENFKIIGLYESLGFKVEKRIENYYGDGEPRLMLVKES